MSGIYIPGIEMPKSCGYCLFWEPGEYRFADCLATDEAVMCRYDDERPSECPLIPAPDHGDLIDRRDLLEANKHLEYPTDGKYRRDRAWAVGFNAGAARVQIVSV